MIIFENCLEIAIFNSSCVKNNVKNKDKIDGGGTFLFFLNVQQINIDAIVISNSYNDHTTVGIIILSSKVFYFH